MKLYKGQKVVIRRYVQRPTLWNSSGEMDIWMGKAVTIQNPLRVTIKEADHWVWRVEDFENLVQLEDDLFEI